MTENQNLNNSEKEIVQSETPIMENVVENGQEPQKAMGKLPKYRLVESQLEHGVEKDIIRLQLDNLIFEKMFILFERHEPAIRNLESAKVERQMEKDRLLAETDFKKELGITTKPTIADKDAVMAPFLAKFDDKIEKCEENVVFYKNKITILNDLIESRRLQLKMEAALLD